MSQLQQPSLCSKRSASVAGEANRRRCLAPTIHECLLRHPILLPGGAFLVRPPRRTTEGTPPSAVLARSPGGLRSRPSRDGIHEESRLGATWDCSSSITSLASSS